MVAERRFEDLGVLEKELAKIIEGIGKTPVLSPYDSKIPEKVIDYYDSLTRNQVMSGLLVLNNHINADREGWHDEEIEFMLQNQKDQILRQSKLSYDAVRRALDARMGCGDPANIQSILGHELNLACEIALAEAENEQIKRQDATPPIIRPYLESIAEGKLTDVTLFEPGSMQDIKTEKGRIVRHEFLEACPIERPIGLERLCQSIMDVFGKERYRIKKTCGDDTPLEDDEPNIKVDMYFENLLKGHPWVRIIYGLDGFNVTTQSVRRNYNVIPSPIWNK